MPILLIRHRVSDFAAWKAVYEAHEPARQAAGLDELFVLRDGEDPAQVVLVYRAADAAKATEFAGSPDLKAAMERAGVVGRPELSVLDEA